MMMMLCHMLAAVILWLFFYYTMPIRLAKVLVLQEKILLRSLIVKYFSIVIRTCLPLIYSYH